MFDVIASIIESYGVDFEEALEILDMLKED